MINGSMSIEAVEPGRGAIPGTPVPQDTDTLFDDGLVHDHGWACRERGAPAC